MPNLRSLFKPAPADTSKPDQPTRRRRIAVLGLSDVDASSTEWAVHSFPWSYQGQTTVVADYDVAVVNLLGTNPQEGFIARGLPPDVNGDPVLALLHAATQLVLSGGELVVVGHPDVHVKTTGPFSSLARSWTSAPHWTTMALSWDERTGDQIELLVQEGQPEPSRFRGFYRRPQGTPDPALRFLSYLEQLRRYEYSLTDAQLANEQSLPRPIAGIHAAGPVAQRLRLDTRELARTRHGGAVASEHLIEVATRPVAHREHGWSVVRHGRVVLLPSVGLPPREAIALVLRTAYGVHVTLPAPPWLAALAAPGESSVLARASAVQKELDEVSSKLRVLEGERARAREVLAVVATGDQELEDGVRDILRRLGAQVELPVEPNKEDGWIVVAVDRETFYGALEIKSTRNETFDESGLRQLLEWVGRSDRDRKRTHKGIFIGNSAYARPPAERGDPFSSSFRQSAEANGFVALTTVTLLRELGRVVDDSADAADFWRRLFDTRGVLE